MPPNSLFFLTVAMSLMFIASLSFASEVARSYQKKSHKLQQLKEQIKDLSSDIENRKSAFDKLTQRLRQSEITIGKTAHTLTKIKLHITKTTQQLDRLTRANQQQKLTLSQQKNILSQQLNAWFIMDNKTPLKMLFNQEDPAHSGRISQYYTLFNQAILKTITQLDIAQKKHNKQRHLIQEKTQTLETLLAETLLQQKQLSRQQTIQQQARQKLKSTVTALKNTEAFKELEQFVAEFSGA